MRPRIRTIKPEFFKHEKVRAVPRQVRFTMVGLISAADDRGRIEFLLPALRGFIYPGGDVSERQLNGEIEKIIAVRFAVSYIVGLSGYLWIPNFWRHQRINRPTESELPPHPDDPYRGLPIVEAIEKFTQDERNGHGGFTEGSVRDHGVLSPSRAGARSSSLSPSDPVPSSLCQRLAARVRANDPRSDPKPESDRWLTDMRLLVADRGGDVGEVERVIDWCQSDSFWRSNILSPGKLRKQFTQLLLKAELPSGRVVPLRSGRQSPSDLLRSMAETEAAERVPDAEVVDDEEAS